MNGLPTAYRVLLYGVLAVLFLSGVLWEAGVGRALLMAIHGAAAMATLVLLGGLLVRHVPAAWAKRANRASGAALLAGCAWLVASGYLLYYAGSEEVRGYAAQSHLWVGIGLAVAFLVHRRARAEPSYAPRPEPGADARARSSP
jgi:hypothetical protein